MPPRAPAPARPSFFRASAARFRRFLTRGRFSTLTRRIVVFNVAALVALVAGILYLNQFRQGLIDTRKQSLLVQAEIIAGAIAETATNMPPPGEISTGEIGEGLTGEGGTSLVDPERAAPILRRLTGPTQTRARLFDRDGQIMLDSRNLVAAGQIIAFDLPPPEPDEGVGLLQRLRDAIAVLLPGEPLPRYREAVDGDGLAYEEVRAALAGISMGMERVNERGELIVSIAVPIQRFKAVQGTLMLSTEGGDIDAIVSSERYGILQVFLVALGVTILLSVLLAGTIAEPVRRLAEAADRVRRGGTDRTEIPDFTERRDEIGELSGALRDMMDSLYQRIDAIERFAADVAHEIKNPLTSVRSAVETLTVVKDDAARDRLIAIVQEDVRRLDRLISDISEASRLDAELGRGETAEVDLLTLVETVAGIANETRADAGRRVMVSVEQSSKGRGAFKVDGIESRLGQVVRNLVENALSFSPPGGAVTLSLKRTPDRVVLLVEDEGPGIPDDNLERVFERFYTHRPDEDAFGRNSGLGLSISRQIVEAHHGVIHAENRSPQAKGARFVVDLPAA